jgi:hypothetical protein
MGFETEVLGETPPQCLFVNHESHMTWPGIERGPLQFEAGIFFVMKIENRAFLISALDGCE